MATRSVAAWELRPGWTVTSRDGSTRRVALARCEGAPAHVVVHWVGTTDRSTYRLTQDVTIEDSE